MNPDDASSIRAKHARTRLIAWWFIGLAVAAALDLPIYVDIVPHTHAWTKSDFPSLLKYGGYLPTWMIVAATLALHDRARAGRWCAAAWRRAMALLACITLAGCVGELAKIIFRRERGDLTGIWYSFRPFTDRPLSSAGLSMPSSHALIAFSAAIAMSKLVAGVRPAVLTLAICTALSRVLSGAHFVTDVYVSAAIAGLSVHVIDRAFQIQPPPHFEIAEAASA